jgi:hypothetical protein
MKEGMVCLDGSGEEWKQVGECEETMVTPPEKKITYSVCNVTCSINQVYRLLEAAWV